MWKPIKGYEGSYEVSDKGEVRSLPRTINATDGRSWHAEGKLISPFLHSNGYLLVRLPDKPKARVHRLVAEAFLPNPDNLSDVNHIDEVKTNNVLGNLEWCTRSHNMKHSTKKGGDSHAAKYSLDQVQEVISLRKSGLSYKEVSRRTGISDSQCARYCRGEGRLDLSTRTIVKRKE